MTEERPTPPPENDSENGLADEEYRIVGAVQRVIRLQRDYTLLEREFPAEEVEKPKNVRPNLKLSTGPMNATNSTNRPARKVGRTMSDIKV